MEKQPSWTSLERDTQVNEIVERSHSTPCLIFKHSTACYISDVALARLERKWSFNENELIPFFVDAIKHRNISKHVCEVFEEHHETPQILLITKGEVILEANNMDIHVEEIKEVLS